MIAPDSGDHCELVSNNDVRRRTVTQVEKANEPVSGQLLIHRSDDTAGVVLALSGELDLASAPELEKALGDLQPKAGQRVLLDLAQLTFMDSTGLGVVVRAKQDTDAAGGVLALTRPTPQVQRLLELVGLLERLVVDG
jgi:anti-sigma B factor antagonist